MLLDTLNQEKRELCQAIAIALRNECNDASFAYPLRHADRRRMILKLHDTIPSRSDLRFQSKNKQAAPKTLLERELAAEPGHPSELFCMVHGDFVLKSGMDIEHADAASDIRKRQRDLLQYLNRPENRQFANALLAQRGISELLRRDTDRVIKGSRYFYKTCYNNIGNLWLACHACNILKDDESPLSWFQKSKYFGRSFVQKVTRKGGLHQGLLTKTVHHIQRDDAKFKLSRTGPEISVPTAQGQGFGSREIKPLGLVVREWFWRHHREEYEAHRQFYRYNYDFIKKSLDEIRELAETDEDSAKKLLTRLREDIAYANEELQSVFTYRKQGRHSDSATTEDANIEQLAEIKQRRIRKAVFQCIKDKYIVKIENLVRTRYPNEFAQALLGVNRHKRHRGDRTKAIFLSLSEATLNENEKKFQKTFVSLTRTKQSTKRLEMRKKYKSRYKAKFLEERKRRLLAESRSRKGKKRTSYSDERMSDPRKEKIAKSYRDDYRKKWKGEKIMGRRGKQDGQEKMVTKGSGYGSMGKKPPGV